MGRFHQLSSKIICYMEVSWNGGIPRSSILIGFSLLNQPFWGYPEIIHLVEFSILNHPAMGVPPWLWKPPHTRWNIYHSVAWFSFIQTFIERGFPSLPWVRLLSVDTRVIHPTITTNHGSWTCKNDGEYGWMWSIHGNNKNAKTWIFRSFCGA